MEKCLLERHLFKNYDPTFALQIMLNNTFRKYIDYKDIHGNVTTKSWKIN